jgi:hypothetical protein
VDNRTVFVIGDSISIHYGLYLEKMIGGKYHYNRKGNINNNSRDSNKTMDANNGDSRMVLEYLSDESCNGTSYDILLLNCGLHDIRVSRDTNMIQVNEIEYRENLNKIFDIASKLSNKVIWVKSTPVVDSIHNSRKAGFLRFNKDIILYNNIAEKITDKYKIPTIDLYTFTEGLGENIYCDHVHFKEEIRALQGAFIADYLLNI